MNCREENEGGKRGRNDDGECKNRSGKREYR